MPLGLFTATGPVDAFSGPEIGCPFKLIFFKILGIYGRWLRKHGRYFEIVVVCVDSAEFEHILLKAGVVGDRVEPRLLPGFFHIDILKVIKI